MAGVATPFAHIYHPDLLPARYSLVVFFARFRYTPAMPSEPKDKTNFYIIDGNSYIYRAFYAIRGLTTSSGLPTNAVFGFANMLLKVIKEKSPDMLAIAFDPKGPTRRHGEFKEYKRSEE